MMIDIIITINCEYYTTTMKHYYHHCYYYSLLSEPLPADGDGQPELLQPLPELLLGAALLAAATAGALLVL